MRNIEMHCHSTRSDGKNTPEQVLREAQKLGIDFLALTDHDVISPQDFQSDLRNIGIDTCDSVEILARNYELGKSLHLVSYAQIFHNSLQEVLSQTDNAKKRLRRIQFQKIVDTLGLEGSEDDFSRYMTEKLKRDISTSNKYDMARYFWSKDENKDIMRRILGEYTVSEDIVTHFYEECLKRGGRLFEQYGVEIEEYEPSVEQTVEEVVLKTGGVVSLAHPNVTFSDNKGGTPEFQRTIGDYVEKGVNAIEVNTQASPEWVSEILRTQKQFRGKVLLTFGSDCHQIGYDGRDRKHASIGELNPYIDTGIVERNFGEFKERIGV
ncbi:PHP domain-containing protein [Candidatus Gracilibacteria bacterium]|nr:PHP domain-containing protein [Candidatus Gracilibacteria bacterium]